MFDLSILWASSCAAGTTSAVEFYNPSLLAYFMTADPDEVAALEEGSPPGWKKTGYAFSVATDTAAGAVPVCRFFSATFAPKSSHFYTPYAAECAALKAGTIWTYESVAFYLQLPSPMGTCPPGGTSIYRLYNNGVTGAPNHRYTASQSVYAAMHEQGWTVEGDAVTGVFACGPAAPTGGSANITVFSTRSGLGYDISIYVPRDYDATSAPLPVVYALDAQVRLAGLQEVLRANNPKVVVVLIYDMERHIADYTMPGASDYLAFLTKDVFPYIESNYRVDPRKRVISGLATSANFPVHALYLEIGANRSFAQYWITNGSFTQQQESINTEEARIFEAVGGSPFAVTIIFARGATAFGP